MRLVLNGQAHEAPAGATVLALLESLGIAPKQVAVEVNGQVLPRAEFSRRTLTEDDRVEIVQFVGGG